MTASPSLVVCLAALAAFLVHKLYSGRRGRRLRLPPSPKSYPLIGHLLSIPQESDYLEYIKMGEQLGSKIISLSALGMDIIVLNDRTDAMNLFDKRSAIYSDRPIFPMVSEPSLFNWEDFGSAVPYGERWRKYRRLLNPWLNKQASAAFHGSQEHEARLLLRRLLAKHKELDSSDDLESEFYFTLASTLFRSVYGYEPKSPSDPFLLSAQISTLRLGRSALPSNFLVNAIPALKYVPSWFPGAGWKRTARAWRLEKDALISDMYKLATDQIKEGKAEYTIVASMRTQALRLGLTEEQTNDYVQQLAMTLFGAGTDTSASVLSVFCLAMVLFPEAQKKAQKELDTVIGDARLPSLTDQPRLGYVGRLIQEVLRWGPIAPLAVPRAAFEDDTYQGYDIPKGTMIMGNVWAITRDQEVYEDPEAFNPDRFLDPFVPPAPVFGWGRRRCPGLHFAEASLFIIIASILSTFDINPAKDKDGNDILPTLKMVNSIILHPEPFKFKLTPRSARHERRVASLI